MPGRFRIILGRLVVTVTPEAPSCACSCRSGKYMAYCLGLAVGCAADPLPARQGQLDTSDPYALVLSDHDECLPDGEVLPGDVFIAFIEADGRQPTRSEDRSGGTPSASDSRAAEP